MLRHVKSFWGIGVGVEKVTVIDDPHQWPYLCYYWKVYLGHWVWSGKRKARRG